MFMSVTKIKCADKFGSKIYKHSKNDEKNLLAATLNKSHTWQFVMWLIMTRRDGWTECEWGEMSRKLANRTGSGKKKVKKNLSNWSF